MLVIFGCAAVPRVPLMVVPLNVAAAMVPLAVRLLSPLIVPRFAVDELRVPAVIVPEAVRLDNPLIVPRLAVEALNVPAVMVPDAVRLVRFCRLVMLANADEDKVPLSVPAETVPDAVKDGAVIAPLEAIVKKSPVIPPFIMVMVPSSVMLNGVSPVNCDSLTT